VGGDRVVVRVGSEKKIMRVVHQEEKRAKVLEEMPGQVWQATKHLWGSKWPLRITLEGGVDFYKFHIREGVVHTQTL